MKVCNNMGSQSQSENVEQHRSTSFEAYEDVLQTLQQDKSINHIKVLVYKFISEIELPNEEAKLCSILDALSPILKTLHEQVCNKNVELFLNLSTNSSDDSRQECIENFRILADITIIIDHICDFICGQNVIVKLTTLSAFINNLFDILESTFTLCRDSSALHKRFDIKEILLKFFKYAGSVNKKLLTLLESKCQYNFDSKEDVKELCYGLFKLTNLSSVLCKINISLSVAVWRSILTTSVKYSDHINSEFKFDTTLAVIAKDFATLLRATDFNCMSELKNQIKILRFIVKMITQLCTTFTLDKQCKILLWEFFLEMYRFSEPLLRLQNVESDIIELINGFVFQASADLFQAFFSGVKFKELNNVTAEFLELIVNGKSAFLLLIHAVLIDPNIDTLDSGILNLVYGIVLFIEHSTCQDFFDNRIILNEDENCDLYTELIVSSTSRIMTISSESWIQLEQFLLLKVCSTNCLVALFATDLMCIICSNTTSTLCYDIVCMLLEKLRPALHAHFDQPAHTQRLSGLLRTLYGMLPEEVRVQVLSRFALPYDDLDESHVWRHLGLAPALPRSRYFVLDAVLDRLQSLTGDLLAGGDKDRVRASINTFVNMIDYMAVLSSLPAGPQWPAKSADKLASVIGQLWQFRLTPSARPLTTDADCEPDSYECRLLQLFLERLCKLTQCAYCSDSLFQVISEQCRVIIIAHPQHVAVQLAILALCRQLHERRVSTTAIAASGSGSNPAKCWQDVLAECLRSNDPVVHHVAERAALAAVKDDDNMGGAHQTDFAQIQRVRQLYGDDDEYTATLIEMLQNKKDTHQCVKWLCDRAVGVVGGSVRSEPDVDHGVQPKRMRLQQVDDVNDALVRMQQDVKILQRYNRDLRFAPRHVTAIFNVMNDLKRMV